jgi:hypothetical protein
VRFGNILPTSIYFHTRKQKRQRKKRNMGENRIAGVDRPSIEELAAAIKCSGWRLFPARRVSVSRTCGTTICEATWDIVEPGWQIAVRQDSCAERR